MGTDVYGDVSGGSDSRDHSQGEREVGLAKEEKLLVVPDAKGRCPRFGLHRGRPHFCPRRRQLSIQMLQRFAARV